MGCPPRAKIFGAIAAAMVLELTLMGIGVMAATAGISDRSLGHGELMINALGQHSAR